MREITSRIFPLFLSEMNAKTNGNAAVTGSAIAEYPESAFRAIIAGLKSIWLLIKSRSSVKIASKTEYVFPFKWSEYTSVEKHNTAVTIIAQTNPRFAKLRERSHFSVLSIILHRLNVEINLAREHIHKCVIKLAARPQLEFPARISVFRL